MGAHIGPLHPVELAVQHQLFTRSLSYPDLVIYGPSGNRDGADAFPPAGLPSIVLDCNTGSDGVLTLSPVSDASPTGASSSGNGSPTSAAANGKFGSGNGSSNGQGYPSTDRDTSSSIDSDDPSACYVDPNASYPEDFSYPGPDCVHNRAPFDPALGSPSSGTGRAPTSSGNSGANAATGGLGNGGPLSSCGAADAASDLDGVCNQGDSPGTAEDLDPCNDSGNGNGDGAGNGCPQSDSGNPPAQVPAPAPVSGDDLDDDADCDDLDDESSAPSGQAVPTVPNTGSGPADGEPCPDENDGSG